MQINATAADKKTDLFVRARRVELRSPDHEEQELLAAIAECLISGGRITVRLKGGHKTAMDFYG